MQNRFRWFWCIERRLVDFVVRRVDQMERSQTVRGRGRPRKTIREVSKINDLDKSMVLDKTLGRKLICVGNPS